MPTSIVVEQAMMSLIRTGGNDTIERLEGLCCLVNRPSSTLCVNDVFSEETMLSLAMQLGETEVVKWLITKFPNLKLNTFLPSGVTAAQSAARCIRNECSIMLIKMKNPDFDPYIQNIAGETLVSYALGWNQYRFLLILITCEMSPKPSPTDFRKLEEMKNDGCCSSEMKEAVKCFSLFMSDNNAGRIQAHKLLGAHNAV